MNNALQAQNFEGIFYRYAAFIVARRKVVMAVVALISGLLLAGIGNLRVQVDPNADLPQGHPYVITTNTIEHRFAGRNVVVVGIESLDGDIFQPQVLEVIKDVTKRIEQIPGVVRHRIQSISSSRAKDISGTPDGMVVLPILGDEGESGDELRKRLYANPIYINSIVSSDGKTAFVLADFKVVPENGSYRSILERLESELAEAKRPSVQYHMGGLVVSLAWLEIYSQQMQYLFLLVVLTVMVISYLSFGTLQATFIPMLTGITSVLWTLGLMGWMHIPMDTFNVATPILIMTVAHGHSVQILKRFYELLPGSSTVQDAVCRALAAVGAVMLTAGGIAVLSFLALVSFPLKTIQVFGTMAAIGIAAAVVLEMTLIPAVRVTLRQVGATPPALVKPWDMLANSASRVAVGPYSRGIVIGTTIIILILLCGAMRVKIDNSLKGNFFPDSEVRKDDAFINAHSGGASTVYILFQGHSSDAMKRPDVVRGIWEIQQRLHEQYPDIGKTQSIVDLLMKMHLAMHEGEAAYNVLPDSQELIAQYLLLYSMSGDPEDLSLYIDYDYSGAVVWGYLKNDSSAYIERVIDSLKAWAAAVLPAEIDVSIGGSVAEATALNEVMVRGKAFNIAIIAASVFALSALAFRSVIVGLLVLFPLAITVLANFGIMGWTGMRLDVSTATISALAVGVGADYAIYLIARTREELLRSPWDIALARSVQTAGKAIISVALAVGGGYGVLLLSGFNAHVRLGTLVVVSMVASALSSVCVLPAFIHIVGPNAVLGLQAPDKLAHSASLPKGEGAS